MSQATGPVDRGTSLGIAGHQVSSQGGQQVHYSRDGLWQLSPCPRGIHPTTDPRCHHRPRCLCPPSTLCHDYNKSGIDPPCAPHLHLFSGRPRLVHSHICSQGCSQKATATTLRWTIQSHPQNSKVLPARDERQSTVSVDRLKPAHRDTPQYPSLVEPNACQPAPHVQPATPPTPPSTAATTPPPPTSPPPNSNAMPTVSTRVGRRVRFPKRLQDYVR